MSDLQAISIQHKWKDSANFKQRRSSRPGTINGTYTSSIQSRSTKVLHLQASAPHPCLPLSDRPILDLGASERVERGTMGRAHSEGDQSWYKYVYTERLFAASCPSLEAMSGNAASTDGLVLRLVYRLNTYPLIHLGFLHAFLNAIALVPLMERFEAEHGTLLTGAMFLGRKSS